MTFSWRIPIWVGFLRAVIRNLAFSLSTRRHQHRDHLPKTNAGHQSCWILFNVSSRTESASLKKRWKTSLRRSRRCSAVSSLLSLPPRRRVVDTTTSTIFTRATGLLYGLCTFPTPTAALRLRLPPTSPTHTITTRLSAH